MTIPAADLAPQSEAGWRRLRRVVRRAADPAMIAGVILIAVLSFGVWNAGRVTNQGDYFQFWAVGRLASTGVTDIYSESARVTLGGQINAAAEAGTSTRAARAAPQWRILQTTGTPLLYAVFGALSTGDYDVDSAAWEALSLGVLIAAAIALSLAFGSSGFGALVVTALFVGTSAPLVADVGAGNVNEAQVGILAAFLLLRLRLPTPRGDLAAGWLLGLLIAFKPDLAPVGVLLVVLWFVDRRFGTLRRVLLGMIEGGLLGLVIGVVVWRSYQVWLDWLGSFLGQIAAGQYTIATSNDSLARLVFEQTGFDATPVLAIALTAAIVAAMLRSRWPSASRSAAAGPGRSADGRGIDPNAGFEREVLTVGAAIALALMASPLTWLHYYLLLVPLQLYLLRPGDPDRPRPAIPPALRQGAVSISVVLLAFVPIDAIVGASPTTDAIEAMVAVALLFATAIAYLAASPTRGVWRPRAGDAHPQAEL